MAVCHLHPEAESSPIRLGEEIVLKSCLLRRSAVVLFLWVGEGSHLHWLASQQQYRGVIHTVLMRFVFFFHHRIIGCLYLQSLLLGAFFFFCMKIFLLRVKQKTPKGSRCTVQLPPQVKYLQFVESITQYGVHLRWPYDLRTGETTFQSVKHVNKTQRGKFLSTLYTVLTLEDMNYMSGIQSPFHHTPQHPHSGIRLHSMHVYTLW